MILEMSGKVKDLREKLIAFMDEIVYPNERVYSEQLNEGKSRWEVPPIMDEMQAKAKELGLWNLFLQNKQLGPGLTNFEYAHLKEIMGRSLIGPEVFNCSAPDTGNMELLDHYGSPEQKRKWLLPLLNGKIRSAFVMTEPDVSSSDATNISTRIERDGDEYVVNGRKWWISGIMNPRCKILILMGKSNPNADKHNQQAMILIPMDSPGISIERYLPVFGYDDAPHGHAIVEFNDVRVSADNMILGEGRGFEIAQGRLGPGRIHHCMRLIGLAERALELMCKRATERVAFGRLVSEQGVIRNFISESRIAIDQARLLTLNTAHLMDTVGNKGARKEISMIKAIIPKMALKVIDHAIQVHGGGGVSDVYPLAEIWGHARTLRIADGPDEVHNEAIAKLELRKYKEGWS
jgi:acyl-CoA dehydrogenase